MAPTSIKRQRLIEAGLTWAIQAERAGEAVHARVGLPGCASHPRSDRQRNFPLHASGFLPEGRAPVRAGAAIFAGPKIDADPVGSVTSGGFGPSADRPIAMGYVPPLTRHTWNSGLFADVRGKRLPMTVTSLPFVHHSYKRG